MKAIVLNRYGASEVLEYQDVPAPVPGDRDVLLEVRATSINAGDVFAMHGRPWLVRFSTGFPRPKQHVLGMDAAGVVQAVGKEVRGLRPGDAVYGVAGHTYAELACVPELAMAPKPERLSFEEAAALPTAGFAALKCLRDVGRVGPGHEVLINGASGGVGTFAVQIAKALGASVTGVCSPRNLELVRSLGAEHVVDYTQVDFTTLERRYDLILDNVGNHPFAQLRRVLKPSGLIIPNAGYGGMGYVLRAFALAPFLRQQTSMVEATPRGPDLAGLSQLIEAGQLKVVIDRRYPLAQAAEAFRIFEAEHPRGKVVLTVG